MADRILSVQTLSLTSGGAAEEIVIPSVKEALLDGPSIQRRDAIAYVFDGSNSRDLELVQESGSTEGIKIGLREEKTIGAWRLIAGPPRFVYQPAGPDTTVRVTVVLLR